MPARMRTSSVLAIKILAVFSTVASAEWERVADLPGVGRHHPVTFTLGGYGYVATGSTQQQGNSDDFYQYDPAVDAWSVLPDFPGPDRSYAYGGAWNGKGYLGFWLGGGYLADLWSYDPVLPGWSQLAALPAPGRMHPAFVVTEDGKIFVGMGGGASGNLRDWWEYDIQTNAWTRKADLPGPARHHPYYFAIGRVPYVGLGHGSGAYRDFYRFDPDANTWTRLGDFPGEGRVGGTQFGFNGKGYIASGLDANDQQLTTGEFWEYDPVEDRWAPLPPHPGSGRWAPGTFLVGSTLYLAAGESAAQMEHDMWKHEMLPSADIDGPGAAASPASLVYPNPLRGQDLRLLAAPGASEGSIVRMIRTDGSLVANLPWSAASSIRLPEGIAAGQYFLSIEAPGGSRTTHKISLVR